MMSVLNTLEKGSGALGNTQADSIDQTLPSSREPFTMDHPKGHPFCGLG